MLKKVTPSFVSKTVEIILRTTGFSDKRGGGEPGIGLLISAFLLGYEPILYNLLRAGAFNNTTLCHMARFACNQERIILTRPTFGIPYIQCTMLRCNKVSRKKGCVFVGKLGCECGMAMALDNNRLAYLCSLPDVAKRFSRELYGSGGMTMAKFLCTRYINNLTQKFKKNDRLKALRVLLPPAHTFLGKEFTIHQNTYKIMDTNTTIKGRLSQVCLRQNTEGKGLHYWCHIRPSFQEWIITFPLFRTPRIVSKEIGGVLMRIGS